MIYVLNMVEDTGYHADYCGTKIYQGPKMDNDDFFKLINKYREEFYNIFANIYNYFTYKYGMEIHKIQDIEDRYERDDYDDWIQYYIDCEVHEILTQFLNLNTDQHMSESKYTDLYIKQKLCDEHNFKENVECEIINYDPYDCGCY